MLDKDAIKNGKWVPLGYVGTIWLIIIRETKEEKVQEMRKWMLGIQGESFDAGTP